jgi:heterodisulfide reductase subunit A
MADTEETRPGTVLVVGAGVAGIKAALELAETGYQVLLTEASPHLGGILAKLDHQFPTDHCGMCRMLPLLGREHASQHCLRKSLFHDNIEIRPFTEVRSIEGDAGAYTVELKTRARHVDVDRCDGSGKCIQVCPIEVPDEFNHGLTGRKAIYQPVPHNVPHMVLVDMNACDKCGECVKACPTGAIDLEAQDQIRTVEVDAVILASGVPIYDPQAHEEAQAYTVSPDVVSSLAFERILSPAGTYDGVIHRPSDGKPARRIAWLQCIGSRNRRCGQDFCSSICCMFALKEAVLAKEKGGEDVEATIFYMDMRTFGKGFYRYREKAEQEHGVNLVRCRVQAVLPNADGSLMIRYFDPQDSEFHFATYDLVVLSTGQSPYEDHRKLADLLKMDLTAQQLLPTEPFSKIRLPRPGIYMCGSLTGLTDISEAVASGTAAAGEAHKLLRSKDARAEAEAQPVEERPSDRKPPRVSVVLCRCKDLDLKNIEARVDRIPAVCEVKLVDDLCKPEGWQSLEDILKKSPANRLLIGACLPYVYRKKLRSIARAAGFNPSLVEVFDLVGGARKSKNGTDWPARATEEIRAAVSKLKAAETLHVQSIPIEQTALVVGGGVTGLRAALSLADRGIQVHVLEKSSDLGGHARVDLRYTVDETDPRSLAADLARQAEDHPRVTVYKNAGIETSSGSTGRYRTRITVKDSDPVELTHGVVILATGGHEAQTDEYCCGQSDRIVTQSALEKTLSAGDPDPKTLKNVVMIQCVGSREKGKREYCSRICCTAALKNAKKIHESNPESRIYVLYRDMMTYGFLEQYYTKARANGVMFVNYDLEKKPQVEMAEGRPLVKFDDPVLGMPLEVKADLVVLATGMQPDESNKSLAEAFKVPLNADGFFEEIDSKWRPVEFNRPGIFTAGIAHSPQPINEALVQAEAAAQKAYAFLAKKEAETARVVSKVHDALCARCEICIEICPFEARSLDPFTNRIVVDPAACQACGLCAAACRNGAAEVLGFNDRQNLAVIDAKLAEIGV